jgi:hypothetical protein
MMVLLGASSIARGATINNVAPELYFRTPGRNTVDKVIGMYPYHVHLDDMASNYGTFFLLPKYEQSWKPSMFSKALFGDALNNVETNNSTATSMFNSFYDNDCSHGRRSINIAGSQVENRTANALMAENFLLAPDFQSVISFRPQIRTFSLDFHFYMELDEWLEGLYFRIYGPLVHSWFDLNFEESTPTQSAGYEAGYFAPAAVEQSSLLQSFGSYAKGNTITVPGVTVQGLQYGKIPGEKKSKTYFDDLRIELGYDVLLDEDYHLGFCIEAAAPTGKKIEPEFLFAPEGSKHWELGGGFTGHYTFWRSEDEDKQLDFIVEGDITHLFKMHQHRTFDLNGKGLSRYMLAEQLGSNVTGLLVNTGTDVAPEYTTPNAQFKTIYAPVANFSTREVKVSIGVQADIVAMLNFTAGAFSWDFGYNYWGRSKEKISLRDDDSFPTNTWALKGDAQVYGFTSNAETTGPLGPIALSATENSATIIAGTNGSSSTVTNANVDNATLAFTGVSTAATQLVAGTLDDTNAPININTSNPAVFIALTDLNVEGAETRGMSNSLFTHFNYTWLDKEDWTPYLGLGVQVTFGNRGHSGDNNSSEITTNSSTVVNTDSNHHVKCEPSSWAVWLKGGISFN